MREELIGRPCDVSSGTTIVSKPRSSPRAASVAGVPGAARPEGEVLADRDHERACRPPASTPAHEVVGGQVAQSGVEAQHDELVDAELADELLLDGRAASAAAAGGSDR